MTSFTDLVDVAAERLGGRVLIANDDFFAPKENLLKSTAPVWKEGEYTDRGKWMDGWETRRRRTPGYDWCVIRLACPAVLHGMVVNTAFFTGNYPERCSLEACLVEDERDPVALAEQLNNGWKEMLPYSALRGDCENPFPIASREAVSHIRFNIYPDGGVARLRVYGEPVPSRKLQQGVTADLAALLNGGMVVDCSDMFFGHRHNLILPGHSTFMGDGWETQRRRGPGHDWTIIRLARRGIIDTIEVDTDHFKGNAPESCSIEICDAPGALPERLSNGATAWTTVLARSPLEPNTRHLFSANPQLPASHARLCIYPDGGIARLRLLGRVLG